MIVAQALKSWLVENDFAVSTFTNDDAWLGAAQKALDSGKLTVQKLAELSDSEISLTPRSKSPSAKDVFGGVRIKKPSERYSSTKSVGKHSRTGLPVRDGGREVETVSQLEHAKAGVFLKRIAQRSGLQCELNEHENELLAECFESETWCGKIGGEYHTGIAGSRVKVLLDDSTSGGQSLVPEFFDANVISFPLLHSEILPRVDLVNVSRGTTVESASINNPTMAWAASEATATTAFTTTSLVAAIDTDIHAVTCAIEIGRDFLSDAAVDVGRVLTENIGQRLLNELDRVIVGGNGTTEPDGILGFSGLTDIGVPAGGSGAAPQVNDYEALLFGIGKQYRTPMMRCAFIANDVSYRRARGIPVGGADARRVFGMDHGSYTLLEHPFAVQNSLANTVAIFGALAKYRLYRRQAQEVRFTTEGKTLALTNTALLTVRGRYGGQVVDANAFSFSDNWQA